MKRFFHNLVKHPSTSSWGVMACIVGLYAAAHKDFTSAVALFALGLQQFGSLDADKVEEKLPPPDAPRNGPDPAALAVLAFALVLGLSGCSPRSIPTLSTTTTVRDTVLVVGASRVDTVLARHTDTVTVERERLRVQVQIRRDTLRIDAECRPDTVRFPVQITTVQRVPVYIDKPGSGMLVPPWLFVAIIVAIGILATIAIHRK